MGEEEHRTDILYDTCMRLMPPILILLSILFYLIFSIETKFLGIETPPPPPVVAQLKGMARYLTASFYLFVTVLLGTILLKFDWRHTSKKADIRKKFVGILSGIYFLGWGIFLAVIIYMLYVVEFYF